MSIKLLPCIMCGDTEPIWTGNIHQIVICRVCDHRAPDAASWNYDYMQKEKGHATDSGPHPPIDK